MKEKQSTPPKPVKPVRVVTAKRALLQRVVSLTGTLEPVEKAEICSKVPGRVEKVFCNEGDKVRAGELLIQLEDDDLKAAVMQAEAALSIARARRSQAKAGVGFQATQTSTQIQQAKNNLTQAEATHTMDRKDLARTEALFARGAIARQQLELAQTKEEVSRKVLDSAQQNLNLARASVAQDRIHEEDVLLADAGISQAEAGLLVARTQLHNARIFSPISGIVTFRGVEPGELVAASTMGKAMPLIKVVSNSALNVEAQVPEKDISLFREGAAIGVIIDAAAPGTYRGTITAIIPAADQQSRSFKVKVSLPADRGRLKSGMFARLEAVSYNNPHALLVPRESLQVRENEKVVFVVDGCHVAMKKVKPGLNNETHYEILSGLTEGEQVVAAGQTILEEGDEVKIEGEEKH